MRIISRPALRQFARQYPDAQKPLDYWYTVAKREQFQHFAAVKATFGSVDQVGAYLIFNIGGNKYRFIVRVLYASEQGSGIFWIDQLLSHKAYDQWRPNG